MPVYTYIRSYIPFKKHQPCLNIIVQYNRKKLIHYCISLVISIDMNFCKFFQYQLNNIVVLFYTDAKDMLGFVSSFNALYLTDNSMKEGKSLYGHTAGFGIP